MPEESAGVVTIEKPLNDVQVLIQSIQKAREKSLLSRIGRPSKREILWFSDVHTCDRRNFYAMAEGDQRAMWGPNVQAKMNAGSEWENINKRELSALGFEPLLSQEVCEIKRGGKTIARGKTDFSLASLSDRHKIYPFEHKCVQKQVFDAVNNWRDLLRNVWTTKYVRQLMLYMYAKNVALGAFMLCDFQGHWKLLDVELDYDMCEETIKHLENSIAAFDKGEAPQRVVYSKEMCGKCDFALICIPDIKNDPRLQVVGNEALAAALEIQDANMEAWKKVEAAKKLTKATFEGVPAGEYTVGNFIVHRKDASITVYDLTDEQKKQFGKKKDYCKNKVERFSQPDPEQLFIEPTRLLSIEED